MSIRRSARMRNFTTLDNAIFAPGLSFRAIGLLAYLLSKPDHWEVSVAQLVNFSGQSKRPDGRDSVYAILGELIDAGFIIRTQAREAGKLNGYDYEVFDVPQPKEEPVTAEPETASPNTDVPYTDEPYPAETTQVNTDVKKTLKDQVNTESLVDGIDGMFDKFWKLYPRKVGKDAARKAFAKRKPTPELFEQMIVALAAQCQSFDWIKDEGRYIPHPATWLNQGRWQDELRTGGRPAQAQQQNRHHGLDQRRYGDDSGQTVLTGGL